MASGAVKHDRGEQLGPPAAPATAVPVCRRWTVFSEMVCAMPRLRR